LQTLENKVLSRGIIGKSAPILAEITIRKSQRLLRLKCHGLSSVCRFGKAFGRIWYGPKPLLFYALSRCMGRKCTWMLAKIKYRKSQGITCMILAGEDKTLLMISKYL
jgi:hypothetical protein